VRQFIEGRPSLRGSGPAAPPATDEEVAVEESQR
jgi:hypothetical protein